MEAFIGDNEEALAEFEKQLMTASAKIDGLTTELTGAGIHPSTVAAALVIRGAVAFSIRFEPTAVLALIRGYDAAAHGAAVFHKKAWGWSTAAMREVSQLSVHLVADWAGRGSVQCFSNDRTPGGRGRYPRVPAAPEGPPLSQFSIVKNTRSRRNPLKNRHL